MAQPDFGFVIWGFRALSLVTFAFGAWSAAKPARSIALYQAIMRFFNWRVEPIDAPRELRTTRWLGLTLATFSFATLALLR